MREAFGEGVSEVRVHSAFGMVVEVKNGDAIRVEGWVGREICSGRGSLGGEDEPAGYDDPP